MYLTKDHGRSTVTDCHSQIVTFLYVALLARRTRPLIHNLRFAGHETTSGILGFTLLDLAQNIDCQNILRKEIANMDINDCSALDKLPYLDAVIREGCVTSC